MLSRFGLSKEPIAYVTLAVMVALTFYKVKYEGMPLSQVMSEDYLEYAITAAGGLVGRFAVFAKPNVGLSSKELQEYELTVANVNRADNAGEDAE